MRALTFLACWLAIALSGCASHAITPLEFSSSDDRVEGLLDQGQLYLGVDGRRATVAKPDHYLPGRSGILVNTDTGDGRYVSLYLDSGSCPSPKKAGIFHGAIRVGSEADHYDAPVQSICGRKIGRREARRVRERLEVLAATSPPR